MERNWFYWNYSSTYRSKIRIKWQSGCFEILWDAIANRRVVQAKEISKFPANRRDLALVVADNVPAGDIIEACKQAGGEN